MKYQELDKFEVPNGFRGKSAIYVQLWWVVQSSLFRFSPQFAYGWRRFLLRMFGAKIGKKVIIRPSAVITYPWKLSIGDFSWVGDDVVLYSLGNISIGHNSVVSQRCYICTGSHDYKSKYFNIFADAVFIGNGAWLATDVYVSPGVKIGDGCVVGARSSVFKDMPSSMVCLGTPAKPVKARY